MTLVWLLLFEENFVCEKRDEIEIEDKKEIFSLRKVINTDFNPFFASNGRNWYLYALAHVYTSSRLVIKGSFCFALIINF